MVDLYFSLGSNRLYFRRNIYFEITSDLSSVQCSSAQIRYLVLGVVKGKALINVLTPAYFGDMASSILCSIWVCGWVCEKVNAVICPQLMDLSVQFGNPFWGRGYA